MTRSTLHRGLLAVTLAAVLGGALVAAQSGTGLLLGGLCHVMAGTSLPESAVSSGACGFYIRQNLTTPSLWFKEDNTFATTGWVQISTAANAVTLTNKTLNAESTGNAVTLPFTTYVPAARCDNATATSPEWSFPTSNPGVPACQTGSNTQFGTMDFADGGSALSAQWHMRLPADWTGALDASLRWFTSATSGDVVWQVATICVADAETADPALNAASTVTDTAKGTTLQLNDAAITGVTTTGCAAGEELFVKVLRDPGHASDTLAATARLVGVELTYRRAM